MKALLLSFSLLSTLFLFGCTSQTKEAIPPQALKPFQETPAKEDREISIENTDSLLQEVAQHNSREDCWTLIDGSVADITSFFGKHPGGDDKLEQACGKDASVLFSQVKKHDPAGYEKLQEFIIEIPQEDMALEEE